MALEETIVDESGVLTAGDFTEKQTYFFFVNRLIDRDFFLFGFTEEEKLSLFQLIVNRGLLHGVDVNVEERNADMFVLEL
jgi:hypothetical protein